MIQNRFRNIVEDMKGHMPVLLAVSGGMDSMCMADLFYESCGTDVIAIAHCNFNLRGKDSDADEEIVRNWADARGVKLYVRSFQTSEYAHEKGISIEMAARELRYDWFAYLCISEGYKAVAVAHHADDNAETLLLNLARGTGLKGITGMKQYAELPYGNDNHQSVGITLIRPMLAFSRKQIEGYVLRQRIPFRTDSTNFSVEYKRNRIRHEVIPSMVKINPSLISSINKEMGYFSDAYEIVSQWCSEKAKSCTTETFDENGCLRISVSSLMTVRQWRYLLYHILEPYGFNSSILSSLESLLISSRTSSGKFFESEDFVLNIERNQLQVRRKTEVDRMMMSVTVTGPGQYSTGQVDFVVECVGLDRKQSLKQPEGVLIFDADKLTFPFFCRGWKKGDWMIPLGMKGKKKLSDMFSDLKYDSAAKSSALVIAQSMEDQHVAALLGVRMDDRYKVVDRTENIIRMRVTKK